VLVSIVAGTALTSGWELDLETAGESFRLWRIWSNQKGAWWKPNKRGYTYLFHEAGHYTRTEVDQILERTNFVNDRPGIPNEVAILIAEELDNEDSEA
jgi:hypothetical protein